MYTQQEIRSPSNNLHIYAPKGVQVKVLSTSIDGICTVEYKGDKFSCRLDKLGEKPPIEDVIINNELDLF